MVWWFGFCVSTAGCMGSVPGGGTKILHSGCMSQKNIKKSSEQNSESSSGKEVLKIEQLYREISLQHKLLQYRLCVEFC